MPGTLAANPIKNSIVTPRALAVSENVTQFTSARTSTDRPDFKVQSALETSVSTKKSNSSVGVESSPRTSVPSTVLFPTSNTSENSFAGGNRMFSAAKVYQRDEGGESSTMRSKPDTTQIVNIKGEPSSKGSHHVISQREYTTGKVTFLFMF